MNLDHLILNEIVKDSSCSIRALSRRVGIPRSTLRDRIYRLSKKGYVIIEPHRSIRYLTLKGYEYIEDMDTTFAARD